MITESYLKADGETLSVAKYGAHNEQPSVLFLHGAGPAGKERVYYLCDFLHNDYGICSISFDFSGHGNSTGRMRESSLARRVKQAKEVISEYFCDFPQTIVGTSMGGHIALELLKAASCKNLILFCPALYSAEAFHVEFNEEFSSIIRQPMSYLNNNVLVDLSSHTGKSLLFIGTEDKIIPAAVVAQYAAAMGEKGRVVLLEGAEHVLHRWALKTPENRLKITQEIKIMLDPKCLTTPQG